MPLPNNAATRHVRHMRLIDRLAHAVTSVAVKTTEQTKCERCLHDESSHQDDDCKTCFLCNLDKEYDADIEREGK